VVTKNGRPAAVLVAVSDEEELERLVLAHTPRWREARGLLEGGTGKAALILCWAFSPSLGESRAETRQGVRRFPEGTSVQIGDANRGRA
jgi:hypothetical protein